MSNDLISINETKMQVREYNGQRVVTLKDIDTVHKRPNGTARKRFSSNRKHFIEGTDFFMITPKSLENSEKSVLRTLGISNIPNRGLTLITESGYLMIVKTFTDDLAWEVQRQLVNGYFKAKEENYKQQVMELPKKTYQTSSSLIPKNPSWYERNRRRMEKLCNRHNVSRKSLYHHILLRLGEEYDLKVANRIYEEELGYPPKYAIDIVSYFPQLAELADDYLSRLEKIDKE